MTDLTITADKLQRLAPALGAGAAVHAAALESARPLADLSTPRRVAHFIAQVLTETAGLRRLTENLHYTDPGRLDALFSAVKNIADARALIAKGPEAIANRVYGGRGGNGPEASGDGWKYRGRGYLQITLHDNYASLAHDTGMDVVADPDLLAEPDTAAKAAALYWKARKINISADADSVTAVTRSINPALAGIEDRKAWLAKTRLIWA